MSQAFGGNFIDNIQIHWVPKCGSCNEGYFLVGKKCVELPDNCSTLNESYNCDRCIPRFTLVDGECQECTFDIEFCEYCYMLGENLAENGSFEKDVNGWDLDNISDEFDA